MRGFANVTVLPLLTEESPARVHLDKDVYATRKIAQVWLPHEYHPASGLSVLLLFCCCFVLAMLFFFPLREFPTNDSLTFLLLDQWMVTGVSGVNGVPAVRHANKENTPEVVNATHQLQSMVGRNAKGNPAKLKPAMKRFHVQVSLINILPFSATLG